MAGASLQLQGHTSPVLLFAVPVSRSGWVIVNQRYQGPGAQLVHRFLLRGPQRPGYLVSAHARAGSSPARPGAPLVRFFDAVSAGRSTWVIAEDEWAARPVAGASLHLQGHTSPAFRACSSAVERFPDEEEKDGSIPSTRTAAMPPFHGWGAALRTLTARVQVLPAVPHRTYGLRSGTSLVSKTGRAGFDPSAACQRLPR